MEIYHISFWSPEDDNVKRIEKHGRQELIEYLMNLGERPKPMHIHGPLFPAPGEPQDGTDWTILESA
jgi:hypothetical protein